MPLSKRIEGSSFRNRLNHRPRGKMRLDPHTKITQGRKGSPRFACPNNFVDYFFADTFDSKKPEPYSLTIHSKIALTLIDLRGKNANASQFRFGNHSRNILCCVCSFHLSGER